MAYNSSYTGPEIDSAIGAVKNKEKTWDGKQDKLNGTEDQLVGFNSAGDAVAVAAPDPLPSGGEEGQVLTKTASGAQWDDIPSDLPSGGTDGQILTKTADGVAWEDAPEGGVTSFNGRTGAITPQSGDYTAEMVGARADTWTPSASDVGAVPTTRTINGKALSSNITLTADDVNAASPPTSTTVTLSASGWASNSQTVTVQGVKTSGQSVRISPVTKTDADTWVAAGVWCSEPTTANQLVFTCDTAPTENININVELQEVQS